MPTHPPGCPPWPRDHRRRRRLCVHNDLAEINAAGRAAHPFRVYSAATVEPRNVAGVPALAATLFPH